jgi:hypothetical protein
MITVMIFMFYCIYFTSLTLFIPARHTSKQNYSSIKFVYIPFLYMFRSADHLQKAKVPYNAAKSDVTARTFEDSK